MQRKLTLTLATSMMMFPQVVETIYSPALTHIAHGFRVSAEMAAQTLSCYFFAFALGVVVWGRMCDVIGRRPTILAGLTLYLLASLVALFSGSFSMLLAARVLAAFGAAVGSVGTQTAIRDRFDGYELARVFSVMGIAMAISPAVGVLSGAVLTYYWGYQGVFGGLALLAALLLGYAGWQLPETRPLQDSRVTQNLRGALTKRVLQMLDKLAKDDAEGYQKFWQQFGLVLKEGPAEDNGNQEAIAKLLRFATTHGDSSAQTVSLEEYVGRMAEGQEKIYYITADSYAAAKSSPHLELFRKKGIEVLLLSDRIDEWMMSYLTEFDGKPFQSVSKADETLDKLADETEEQKAAEKQLEPFIERVKTLLGERVKDVRLTHRLTDTPAIVVTDADEMSTQMAKLFAAAGQQAPEVKYIFELNPEHALVKRASDVGDNEHFAEWIDLLLDQALLAERGTLEDPNLFIRRMNKLLSA